MSKNGVKELEVELKEDVAGALQKAAREKAIRIDRYVAEENKKFLDEIRPKLKDVKGFWTVALLNHPLLNARVSAVSDRDALQHLSDIELVQDTKDPREYELIFHFDENPYFTNKTLSKKYALPEGQKAGPTDGTISQEQIEFDDDDLVAGKVTIDWKADHDLIAKHPRNVSEDAEDFEGDPGSFFHYFTLEGDQDQIGTVVQDILTDPLEAFEGADLGAEFDFDDDEEDEDDEEGSIDLEDEDEAPQKKKQRKD